MAISLVTDIVMDVVKAAAPSVADAARTRLQHIASGAPAGEAFSTHMSADATGVAGKSGDAEAYKKFESLVLGSFIKTMLPQNTEAVYGDGLSGDMWKSILAQHLGDAVAERGGIGIANRLIADHYREGKTIVPLVGANDSAARAELDRQSALSAASVQDFQRKVSQTLLADATGVTGKPGKR